MCLRPIRRILCRSTRTWRGMRHLTALNQLWVADITFIRLRSEFIYLAVVLDAYSRRVIGWDLGRTLQAELAIGALRMALSRRSWKAEGLIHHSDRGVQYASSEYTELLEQNEIQISMSRRGNPYDNARAERFMRTLKEEEVYGLTIGTWKMHADGSASSWSRFITGKDCIPRYDI